MKLCSEHSMPMCRLCDRPADTRIPIPGSTLKKKSQEVKERKPLRRKASRPTRMSTNAEVQPEVGGRCILLGFMPGDCGVKLQRCHIVSQELIRETYKHGAYRTPGLAFWRPMTRGQVQIPAEYEYLTLQQILDDNRNLVHGCENHNKDGREMVEALDARKVAGVPSYPAGFGEFTHAFRFWIEGSTFWYYQPIEAAA